MKFKWLTNFFAARNQARIRDGIRSVKFSLNPKNDRYESHRIVVEVSKVNVKVTPNTWLFGKNNSAEEVHSRARTIIYKYAVGPMFFTKIAHSINNRKKKLYICAPKAWREKLHDYEFFLPRFLNNINWTFRQTKFIASAFLTVLRLAKYSWKNIDFQPSIPFWIIDRVSNNCLPTIDENKLKLRLVPFVRNLLTKTEPLGETWAVIGSETTHYENLNLKTSPQIFPPLKSRLQILEFFLVSSAVLIFSTIKWVLNSPGMPALCDDAVILQYFKRLSDSQLPNWYIVTHTGCGAKPLWIREAEARGVKVAMVFYSINNRHLEVKSEVNPPPDNPEHVMLNWPRYIVRDSYQTAWLKSVSQSDSEFIETGFMPFSDNGETLPELPENVISVFDITPLRDSAFIIAGERYGVITDDFVNAFWLDIAKIGKKLGVVFAVKVKRERSIRAIGLKYRHTLERLKADPNFIFLDPGIAPLRVIDKTIATISVPYTSTAPDAASLGKSSIYYDSTGCLKIDKNLSHGVELIQGYDQLEKWVASQLRQKDFSL